MGGVRAGAERTWNMERMVVTLDVSKLSGWLNASASCREPSRTEARTMRGKVWAGRWESVGRRQHTSGMHGKRGQLWRLGGQ